MEDKKLEKAETDLKKGEADLKIAEHEIEEALKEIKDAEGHHHHEIKFEIQIDRKHYTVSLDRMTGLQLRAIPSPPIGPDRDLFEVVQGGTDRKISDTEIVEMRNGLRFFSAPSQINPGKLNSHGDFNDVTSR
jgi:hypothetical protein